MRRHVLWATTVVLVVSAILDMVSDVYLRSHHIPGSKPFNWDILVSLMLVTWVLVAYGCWREESPSQEARTSSRRWS